MDTPVCGAEDVHILRRRNRPDGHKCAESDFFKMPLPDRSTISEIKSAVLFGQLSLAGEIVRRSEDGFEIGIATFCSSTLITNNVFDFFRIKTASGTAPRTSLPLCCLDCEICSFDRCCVNLTW